MAQERFWNWKDDDSTFRLNWRDLIIIPYGLYTGFDPALGSGLNLVLNHNTTGRTKVKQDKSLSPNMGVWKTKQGVVVTEDSSISLIAATGNPTLPRIDLIIGEHEYTQITGGTAALYKIIQGTPSTNPVIPALTSPNTQTILGYLHVPAGMTNVSQATYERAGLPNWADDNTIMHTNQVQTSTELKVFNVQKGLAVVTELDTTNHLIKNQTDSNFYCIDNLGSTPYADLEEVRGFTNDLKGAGQLVTVFTTTDIVLVNTFGAGGGLIVPEGRRIVRAGMSFTLLDISNTTEGAGKYFTLVQGGEPQHNTHNKYRRFEVWNKSTAECTLVNNGMLLPVTTSTEHGNYAEAGFDGQVIYGLQSLSSFTKRSLSQEAGGLLFVKFTDIGNILAHNAPSVPSGTKPIYIPNSADFSVPKDTTCMFLEDVDKWVLLSIWGAEYTVLNFDTQYLRNLKDVIITNVQEGDMLVYSTGFVKWRNVSTKEYVQNIHLEMGGRIDFSGTTMYSPLQNLVPVVGGAANDYMFSPDFNVNRWSLQPMTFLYDITRMPVAQLGTTIYMTYTQGTHNSVKFNQPGSTGLPIVDSRNRIAPSIPMIGKRYIFVCIGDKWLFIEPLSDSDIPAAQVQVDYHQNNSGLIDFIKNRPPFTTAIWSDEDEEVVFRCYCGGEVNKAGVRISSWGPMNMPSGWPFAVQKIATGQYKITHNRADAWYGVVATCYQDPGTGNVQPAFCLTQAVTANDCIISTLGADNQYADRPFYFMIYDLW